MAGPNGSAEQKLESIMKRNAFNEEGYRFMKIIVLCLLGLIGLLVGYIIYQGEKLEEAENKTRYIQTDCNGIAREIEVLDQPRYEASFIANWAVESFVKTFTFDHVNYRTQVPRNVEERFTSVGGPKFIDAFSKHYILDYVKKNKGVVTAFGGGATILQQGAVDGVYAWVVEFPLKVTIYSGAGEEYMDFIVKAVVVRSQEKLNGIGIHQTEMKGKV